MARNGNGTSPRDPLSTLRGDPTLDAVWRDVLTGNSTPASRAQLVAHYRASRERHLTKAAAKEEASDD